MKRLVIILSLAMTLSGADAGNLFTDGDFSEVKGNAFTAVSTDGGRVTCFMEDATWNKCAKLEITGVSTNKEGDAVTMAKLILGRDGKAVGFAAKPNTTYDFSFDLKGGVSCAYVSAFEWTGDNRWKDMKSLKTNPALKNLRIENAWSGFKGSFKTSSAAKRAAIEVKLWQSSRWGKIYEKGDYILVDNVKITESERNFEVSADTLEAPWTKAIASGDAAIGDFVGHLTGRASEYPTSLKVTAEKDAFVFDFICTDTTDGFTDPGGEVMWKGDECEVWFGPVEGGRRCSQFAVGITGEKFASVDGKKVDVGCFEGSSVRKGNEWKVHFIVPFKAFGRGELKPGEDIAFNAVRYRQKGRQVLSWCRMKEKISDVECFGRLFLDRYALDCANRADYERRRNELDTAALRAKYEKLRSMKFVVTPVRVTSDFEVPFMPREVFDAPEKISVKAAVNEMKSLPVALANLTDREEDYLVVIDHQRPRHKDSTRYNPCATDFGLEGFPAEKLRVRRALKMKDVSVKEPSLRFDPLPYADDSSSLTVASRESALMWFEFDTRGVKPGVYKGDLRVIPLCEYGHFKRPGKGYHDIVYDGEMKTVPIEFEVLPIELPEGPARASGYFSHGICEEGYCLQTELGSRTFMLSPWQFRYQKDAAGNFDYSKPQEECLSVRKRIRSHLEWGKAIGGRPPFFQIAYGAVSTFRSIYNPKKDPAVDERLWPQYLKGIRLALEAEGVSTDDWEVELWDEPPKGCGADMIRMAKLTKECEPKVQTLITLGHHGLTREELEKLARHIDSWIGSDASNWSNPGYAAFLTDELKRGKRVGHYKCYTSMKCSLDSYYRRHAWLGEKYVATGDYLYQFHDDCGALGTMDYKVPTAGGIAYYMFGRVTPSIRYMALREGMNDIRYLAKLREIAPDDPKVRKFLAEAVNRVCVTRAHDPDEADRVRAEAIELILELSAKQ